MMIHPYSMPILRTSSCGQVVKLDNKDVFMCILRFHARAGYLQHYQALLKEHNDHVPYDAGPQDKPLDQYAVERVALADRNHNLPSDTVWLCQ